MRFGRVGVPEDVRSRPALRTARERQQSLVYLRLPSDGLMLLRGVARDEDIAGDGNAHRLERVACRLELAAVERDALADLLRRRELVEQEIEAAACAGRDRGFAAGRQPQRRVRPLVRRRFDNHLVEAEEAAAVRKGLIRGERTHEHIEHLLEARLGLIGRHREACELVVAVAFADSEIEPAAREKIQGRNLLGKQHRIVPWQHKNRRAEAKARRTSRDKGQEGERRRDLADVGEVMLGHEARMETERFGLDVGFDEIEEALRRSPPRRATAALRRRRTIQIAWEDLSEFSDRPQRPQMRATRPTVLAGENTARLRSPLATGTAGRRSWTSNTPFAGMTQAGSTGMFSASACAGTPVDAGNLRDAPRVVKDTSR